VSNRSKARKAAIDFLYEASIKNLRASDLAQGRILEQEAPIREFTVELINGVEEHLRKIDELLILHLNKWEMDRIPALDRAILRLGLYELLWGNLPESVAISEAVELAASLSTDGSAQFINGVLSAIFLVKGEIAL
jgi:N utilization substance protein B